MLPNQPIAVGLLALAFACQSPAQDGIAALLSDPAVQLSRPADRARVVARIAEIESNRLQNARTRAQAKGLPLQLIKPGGGLQELVDFEGDQAVYLETKNTNAAISTAANLLQVSPYSLNGAGLTVGVWDAGSVLETHQEFATGSRVTLRNAVASNYHSTHVGGTIAAAGVVSTARGMANAARIDSYDWNSDISEMTSRAATGPNQLATMIYLSNHSYGTVDGWDGSTWRGTGTNANAYDANFGQYSSAVSSVDSLVYSAPYLLVFWAAGNDGNDNPSTGSQVTIGSNTVSYDPAIHPPGDGIYRNGFETISYRGIGKNVITVGAVNDAVTSGTRDLAKATRASFSSTGPTDDGRIKPDVVANGVGLYSTYNTNNTSYASLNGTSMATPNACGSAALLVDEYNRLFGGAMRASTLRGLLIHTASDLGNAGPDYKFGWGLVNVKDAADLLIDHQAHPASMRLTEDRVSTTITSRTYPFAWDGSSPIRATLCWTDPAGTSTTSHDSRTSTLKNNLNLKLVAPNGAEYFPFVMPFVGTWTTASMALPATTGINNTDNVEQVLVNSPGQTGNWQAIVSFSGNLTNNQQDFGLLISGSASPSDSAPPVPDPMRFASAPSATGPFSISMTATTASDPSGVEYYFTCVSGGGHDSGWQDSPEYEDSGLQPLTEYAYTVIARDKSTNQNATAPSTAASATTEQITDTLDYANGDSPVSGTVTGGLANTQASDDSYEAITEISSGNNPIKSYSYLEHKWSFNVTGGATATFRVEAHHTANSESDDFIFAYSTNGLDGNYQDMITVTKTSDDNTVQSFVLPPRTSGTVYVRVRDTDRTQGNTVLDTLYIDEMDFFSEIIPPDTTPPSLASSDIVDDRGGAMVASGTMVTYTVTFSEDMDAATVTAADFGNAGTSSVSIGTVTEISPGVFTVQATPTSDGTLQLRINQSAVLEDLAGNDLDTNSAIADDTVLIVQTAFEAWSGGASFDADANGDGVDNGLAWLLGAANPAANAIPLLPVPSQNAGDLTLNFRCLKSANRANSALKVQYSKDLGITDPWHEAEVPDEDTTINDVIFETTDDGDFINVRATIPAGAALPGAKLFTRLTAVNAP